MSAIYNILIVDDEELICMGLKSMIERSGLEEIGEVSYTAEPLKVQEIVSKQDIHIIITDIRMPELTGLDLIKIILNVNPNIKFIVLSGYDDFKYVKEAFKLGVFDYILKPGSLEEIKAILEKIITAFKEEERIKLNQQSNNHKYMEAVLENRLNKIFSGSKLNKDNIGALFSKLNINFQYNNFSIGILSFYNNLGEIKNIETISLCLDKLGDKFLDKKDMAIFYFYAFNNNLVFIFNYTDKVNLDRIVKYLQELMKFIGESEGTECFASISDTEAYIESIVSCYSKALEALSYKLIYDFKKVIKYSEIKNKKELAEDTIRQLDKVKELIINNNTVGYSDLIDSMFSRSAVQQLNMHSINKLYNRTISKLKDIIEANKLTALTEDFREFAYFSQLSDLKIYLKTLAFEVIGMLKEKGTDKSISAIVKKYVKENYNKDIDMAVVSNMVSLSYSHFSKIFKEETGMNFSDYLLKLRMEKALEMLSDPANRIQDIAQSIGYGNPKHFTRAFKNHFGFSPSDYRVNPK